MFLNSGTPTAAPRIDFIAFSAFFAPLESPAVSLPGQPAHEPKPMDFKDFQGFSEIFENHDFYSKNKSRQIASGMFLGHPGHAYVSGNDSQTPREPRTRTSCVGE